MNRILEVLKHQGRTQKWLSSKIGKSYNMINSYVKNRRQPSLKTLFKIAETLEVKPHKLISGSEDRKLLSNFMTFAINLEREPEHSTAKLIIDKYLEQQKQVKS